MDLKAFQDRIKSTSLFDEERKDYFLIRAAFYSPETREQMIQELEIYEQELLKYGKKRLIAIRKAKAKAMNQEFLKMEKLHKKEIEKSELQLEKELANL